MWWVRISIPTHYNSIHMIKNYPRIRLDYIDRGTPGKHRENTQTSSLWHRLSCRFRSRSTSFLCELLSGWPSCRCCLAQCEWPLVDNWWTIVAAIMRLLSSLPVSLTHLSICHYFHLLFLLVNLIFYTVGQIKWAIRIHHFGFLYLVTHFCHERRHF